MKIKTKYGAEIDKEIMAEYFQSLIPKCFKLLPLWEQQVETLDDYLYSLLRELCGGQSLILDNPLFIELINNLEALSAITTPETAHKKYKSHVLKLTNLCKKISEQLKKEAGENVL